MSKMPIEVATRIRRYRPPEDGMALFWLGNSFWAIVLDTGHVIYIDPFLSHSIYRVNRWERLHPIPFAPGEADCDLVLITHGHADHLDPDTIPGLAAATGARFISPAAYAGALAGMGVPADRHQPLNRGERTEQLGLTIEAVEAFHQHPRNPQPHAVGYVLRYKGATVYHAGDTAYTVPVRDAVKAAGPLTVALLPISGKRCVLNTEDAAFLAADLGVPALVPMHYNMFMENSADPTELLMYIQRYQVDTRVIIVPVLGGLTVTAAGAAGPIGLGPAG